MVIRKDISEWRKWYGPACGCENLCEDRIAPFISFWGSIFGSGVCRSCSFLDRKDCAGSDRNSVLLSWVDEWSKLETTSVAGLEIELIIHLPSWCPVCI